MVMGQIGHRPNHTGKCKRCFAGICAHMPIWNKMAAPCHLTADVVGVFIFLVLIL